MIKYLIFVLSLACTTAFADVHVEASCFTLDARAMSKKMVYFVLQSYYDDEIGKEIGAFVRYGESKESIPLVFENKIDTDTDDPGLGNFELQRLEILNGRVTGRYTLVQTGAGNRQGRYIDYKNFKTKKTLLFQRHGGVEDCDFPSN